MDYSKLVNGGLARLKPYQAGKPIEEVQRELGLSYVIKLASNENPLGMSPKAIAAAQQAVVNCHYYPDANGYYLKQALSDKFGYDPACLTLGDGSNELINLIFQCFANPQVNVVLPELSFIVYPMEATVAAAEIRTIPLKDYFIDTKALLEAIDDKTRLVVLANPSNPAGTALDYDTLKDFVSKVPESTLVVIDEAYNEYQTTAYVDTAKWIEEFPNLLVCRTFSKAYGLAGLRIGYMVSNAQIAALINTLRAPFNVNAVAQAAAIAALNDSEHLHKVVQVNNAERERYAAYCKQQGLKMIPSSANFVAVDFARDAQPIYQYLLEHGVIVRPVKGYGLDTILRISIGTPEQNDKLFALLTQYLQENPLK